MKLEIDGFPGYYMESETGEIHSRLKTHDYILKPRQLPHRPGKVVQMIDHTGKRRSLYLNRLVYCMQHGIGYDDIPENMFIVVNSEGKLEVIDRSQTIRFASNYVKAAHKRERMRIINERINELEIVKRAYGPDGNHLEIARYIEGRRELLIRHHAKRYNTSREKSEERYALALEWMIDRINDPTSQVLNLTVTMMGLMNKIRLREYKEMPLRLKGETASNSI